MKKLGLVLCAFMLSLLCSGAYAYTLTFDDIPAEQGLRYYLDQYGIMFNCLSISNHDGSLWGPPHSGSNVLVGWNNCMSNFSFKGKYSELYAESFDAYFSTDRDVVVRAEIYRYVTDTTPIAWVDIGATGSSWKNEHVVVTSPLPFNTVVFRPISPGDFSLDDLTIALVPEPSSIAALGIGLLPIAVMARQRR